MLNQLDEKLIFLILLVVISIYDIKTRTIPDFLNLLLLAFLCLCASKHPGSSFGLSAAGAFWAFALAAIFTYINGNIGVISGGDVKMLVVLGVGFGPLKITSIFVASILVGISYLSITKQKSMAFAPVIGLMAAPFLFG